MPEKYIQIFSKFSIQIIIIQKYYIYRLFSQIHSKFFDYPILIQVKTFRRFRTPSRFKRNLFNELSAWRVNILEAGRRFIGDQTVCMNTFQIIPQNLVFSPTSFLFKWNNLKQQFFTYHRYFSFLLYFCT